jgi:hypothetical protein
LVRLARRLTGALLWLGFVLGVRHAFEADSLAALAIRRPRARDAVRIAVVWGLGHAAVLFVAGGALLWAGAQWPLRLAGALEAAAGVVLVWLGSDVLGRVARPLPLRGVEGSGALVLLALPSLRSPAAGMAYLAAFGAGSILGMVNLAVPLLRLQAAARTLQCLVGMTSVAVGALLIAGYIRSIFA